MKADRLNRLRKKGPTPFCHSERSEESLFLFMELNRREILRFAQNDKINYFFRSLFSLSVLNSAVKLVHRALSRKLPNPDSPAAAGPSYCQVAGAKLVSSESPSRAASSCRARHQRALSVVR